MTITDTVPSPPKTITLPERFNQDAVCMISTTIEHLCPVYDEVDEGRITIMWRPGRSSIELHSLAHYLAGWAEVPILHEHLVDQIAFDLNQLVDVISVEYAGETAGMEIRFHAVLRQPVNPASA